MGVLREAEVSVRVLSQAALRGMGVNEDVVVHAEVGESSLQLLAKRGVGETGFRAGGGGDPDVFPRVRAQVRAPFVGSLQDAREEPAGWERCLVFRVDGAVLRCAAACPLPAVGLVVRVFGGGGGPVEQQDDVGVGDVVALDAGQDVGHLVLDQDSAHRVVGDEDQVRGSLLDVGGLDDRHALIKGFSGAAFARGALAGRRVAARGGGVAAGLVVPDTPCGCTQGVGAPGVAPEGVGVLGTDFGAPTQRQGRKEEGDRVCAVHRCVLSWVALRNPGERDFGQVFELPGVRTEDFPRKDDGLCASLEEEVVVEPVGVGVLDVRIGERR